MPFKIEKYLNVNDFLYVANGMCEILRYIKYRSKERHRPLDVHMKTFKSKALHENCGTIHLADFIRISGTRTHDK